ncbi:MAG TPA: hypothetical protein VH373_05175 [Jatrophihabitantaceae bacterium]|jgi:hypothetical protein
MTSSQAPVVRGWQLLAEVLFVGVLVCVACLPVVTVLAAGGAGSVLLRELVEDDRTPRVRRFVALMRIALREPLAVVAPVAVLGVGALDLLAILGGLPGAALLGPAIAIGLALLVICGLRAAARWRPDEPWRSVFAEAVTTMRRDWAGTVLLAGALLVVGIVTAAMPAFAVAALGFLVMAAVAVERRLA